MADDELQKMGSSDAHTPAAAGVTVAPDRAAKIGASRALAEAALGGLADRLADDRPDEAQPSLLLADPDDEFCLFRGPVRHVANTRDTAKRARGRPKGSTNRASSDLANYLLSMGYRDPALILADIANADPTELASELSAPYRVMAGPNEGALVENSITPDVALKLIKDAAAELLPYFHSKRPQQLDVKQTALGVMVIGEIKSEADDRTVDLTVFPAPE